MLYLDLEEEACCIAKMVKCCPGLAMKYLLAEDDYLGLEGINVYSEDEIDENIGKTIDISTMNEYINMKTHIDMDLCDKLSAAETVFFWENGFMAKESFSSEEIESIKTNISA